MSTVIDKPMTVSEAVDKLVQSLGKELGIPPEAKATKKDDEATLDPEHAELIQFTQNVSAKFRSVVARSVEYVNTVTSVYPSREDMRKIWLGEYSIAEDVARKMYCLFNQKIWSNSSDDEVLDAWLLKGLVIYHELPSEEQEWFCERLMLERAFYDKGWVYFGYKDSDRKEHGAILRNSGLNLLKKVAEDPHKITGTFDVPTSARE